MKKITYNKLIRDRIPEIIESAGKKFKTRILDESEYRVELRKKLQEEVNEFLDSDELSEIADILEVIESLVHDSGNNMDEVYAIKETKKKKRGGFDKKIFLGSVMED